MLVAIATTAWAAIAIDAGAQSLGDIARREAERRGTPPQAGKTYTNENLTPDFTTPAPPSAPTDAAAAPAAEPAKAEGTLSEEEAAKQKELEEAEKWGVTPRDQQEPPPPDDHNEEFWRTRSALIKARLANQNAQIEQLRQRMAATRGTSDAERDVTERTFAAAETNLKHLNDEWLRFERQARERNVPEHWWR
jgi:hypothetical protein